MKVYIMRGIPGAGKTLWMAKKRQEIISRTPKAVIITCSADHEMVNDCGSYEFKLEKLRDAHRLCFRKFCGVIFGDKWPDVLIVDNTNIKLWEFAPYYRLAEEYAHDVEIIRVCCTPELASKRNIHGVPAAKVFDMYRELLLTPIPPHYKETFVWSE